MNSPNPDDETLSVVCFLDDNPHSVAGIPVFSPAFEADTFTELEARIRQANSHTQEWVEAGLWALRVVGEILGETWPGDTWKKTAERTGTPWLPADLGASHYHLRHYTRLLEIALRLTEFENTPGIGVLRDQLINDRTPQRWEHTLLQLELAALGTAVGFDVTFEGAVMGTVESGISAWPFDVRVVSDDLTIPFETFALLPSQRWLQAMKRSDEISARVDAIRHRYGVECEVDFHGETLAGDGALERFLRGIEFGAAVVAAGVPSHLVVEGEARALIGYDLKRRYSGPRIAERGALRRAAMRMQQKRDQTADGLKGVWLRVDLLDGTWQFTPWAQSDIDTKIEQLAARIRSAFGRTLAGVAGVLVSSGLCLNLGGLEDATHETIRGELALRRTIGPSRVRETMIIPLSSDASRQARYVRRVYEHEPAWMERALRRAGLPSRDRIFAS
jgi:hypothetical protein